MERLFAQIKNNNYFIINDKKEINHFKAKRLKINDALQVYFKNKIYLTKVIKIEKNKIVLEKLAEENLTLLQKFINVYQSVPLKIKNMDFIVSKLFEVGAFSLTPLITERSFQNIKIIENKINRWEKIINASFKQTKASYLLKINSPLILKNINDFEFNNKSLNIVLDNFNEQKNITELPLRNYQNINLFIGPEGGFSKKEILFFEKMNFYFLKLKPHILKSETAGFIAVSLILNIE